MIKNFSKKVVMGLLGIICMVVLADKAYAADEVYTNSSSYCKVTQNAFFYFDKYSEIISEGTILVLKDTNIETNWAKVYNPDSKKTGYISKRNLEYTKEIPKSIAELTQTNEKIEKVIELASKQLGKPYVWGATGPNSFDCSGLTYYCFKNAIGVTIPRVSREQAKTGEYVSLANLKRGDLLFFGNKKSGSVNHVGIYLGNGQYIHSPQTGDVVKIANTNTSYFKNKALFGRRLL